MVLYFIIAISFEPKILNANKENKYITAPNKNPIVAQIVELVRFIAKIKVVNITALQSKSLHINK